MVVTAEPRGLATTRASGLASEGFVVAALVAAALGMPAGRRKAHEAAPARPGTASVRTSTTLGSAAVRAQTCKKQVADPSLLLLLAVVVCMYSHVLQAGRGLRPGRYAPHDVHPLGTHWSDGTGLNQACLGRSGQERDSCD